MNKLLTTILFMLICYRGYSQITITVTLTGTPNNTTKVIPANLKYNKYGRFGMTADNRSADATVVGDYISGKTFTDGATTNLHNVPWSASIGTQAYWDTDTTQDASTNAGVLSWVALTTLITNGWSVLDNGAFNGIATAGATALGFNQLMNAAQNRNYTYNRTGYVLNYGLVPNTDNGYYPAWEQLGYGGGSSTAVDDDYPKAVLATVNHGLVDVTNWKNDNRYKAHLRHFMDLKAGSAASVEFFDAAYNLASSSNSSTNYSVEYGFKNATLDTVQKVIDSAYAHFNNNIWFCGLQEFNEYFQTIQQTAVKQTLIGDTLTIILDQRFLPDAIRWRDMSFLLNSNSSISSVTVTGADDYSYNTATGLINIYKKKTTGFAAPPNYTATGLAVNGKIALETNDFFIDNNYMVKPSALIDGDTTVLYNPIPGRYMIYKPYEVTLDLSDYGAVVNKIRVYNTPTEAYTTTIILTRNDNEDSLVVGTFNGTANGWTDFDITTKFVASRIIFRTFSNLGFGNEIEVYADHFPYTEQTYTHRHAPLGQMLGTNAYTWNFIESNATHLTPAKSAGFDSLHLRSVRNYILADMFQMDNGATWAFNPVRTGHHDDAALRELKNTNPKLFRWSAVQDQSPQVKQNWRDNPTDQFMIYGDEVSYTDHGSYGELVINTTSYVGADGWWGNWRVEGGGNPPQYADYVIHVPTALTTMTVYVGGGLTYNTGDAITMRSYETSNINIMYAGNTPDGRATLSTWDTLARLSYVMAAHRGRNPNATPFLPNDQFNNDSLGIDVSEAVEDMNEPNADWSGYNYYLKGAYLGAAWSEAYDNHKNYSTFFGAKNADTSMVYSHSGLAIATTDLDRGATAWAKMYRGSRPKKTIPTQPAYWRANTFGWVDNPYDMIQFHNYSYTGGLNQYAGGSVMSGLPVELGVSKTSVDEFVWFRNKYAPWAMVDVGEWGYDLNQGSVMNAPAIGLYNKEAVAGAWSVRTMLYYNAHGIDYAQWYRLYQDYESDSTNSTQFTTMSLLQSVNDNPNQIRLRTVGYYFAQMSEFGDYVYDGTIREDSIYCYRFKNDSSYLYAIWSVESSANQAQWASEKAIFTMRSGTFNLPLPNGTAKLRTFQDASVTMASTDITVSAGSYPISYDLKPVFIQTSALVQHLGRFSHPNGSKIIVKQSN